MMGFILILFMLQTSNPDHEVSIEESQIYQIKKEYVISSYMILDNSSLYDRIKLFKHEEPTKMAYYKW